MFGYITPHKGEMKVKEYELFKAYYCGVCKSMGRRFGPFCRLALNYDSVFMGLFLSSINKESISVERESCIANPLKKKWIVKKSKSVDFSADINILLSYHKLLDDWLDEKKLSSKLLQLLLALGYGKAAKDNKDADHIIRHSISNLSKLEKEGCSSMDEAAEPTADMLRQIATLGCNEEKKSARKAVEWAAYNFGKWIYIIDAYDDMERDALKGCYNPLLLQFSYNGQDMEDFKLSIKEEVKFNLIQALAQAASALELLDIHNKGIIDNILYSGMYKKTEIILEGRSCKKDEKSL